MFYTYILQSIQFPEQRYIGFMKQPVQRLHEHNSGESLHTCKFKPWKIAFLCGFDSQQKAIRFEKYLKTASGRAFINKYS